MLAPKIYGLLERAIRAFARLFPKGDMPKISAIAIICTTVVMVTLIVSKAVDFSSPASLWALGGWGLLIATVVWLCRQPGQASAPESSRSTGHQLNDKTRRGGVPAPPRPSQAPTE